MSAAEELHEHILAALAPVNPDAGDDDARFHIVDKGGADWAARLVKKARDVDDENQALADAEIAAITQWRSDSRARREVVEGRWLPELTEWHAAQREIATDKNGKEKVVNASITLPSGATLKSTRQPVSANVSNFEALAAWVEDNLPAELAGKVVSVTPEHWVPEERVANLAGIKAVFEAKADEGDTGPFVLGGNTVPGVYAERAPTKYSVVTPKAGE